MTVVFGSDSFFIEPVPTKDPKEVANPQSCNGDIDGAVKRPNSFEKTNDYT
jgi:hypothetical protein